MKRVLLIVPPYRTYEAYTNPAFNENRYKRKNASGEDVFVSDLDTDMPLGVLSISAYIKKVCENIEVDLIDFNVEINKSKVIDYDNYEELFGRVLVTYKNSTEASPDYVGVSALFVTQFESLLSLGEIIKQLFPETFLASGGGIPTTMYERIYAQTDNYDALCLGEGEMPWAGLLNADDRDAYLENAGPWVTKKKLENGFLFSMEYVENLDEIPFLDYNLCNMEDYAIAPSARRFGTSDYEKRFPTFHFMGSRGCPNRCCFCASHAVHGREMRFYSLERIREDLTKLKERYNTEKIIIQDDHFMADKERAYAVLKMLYELKLTPIFQNALAMYALDYEFLKTLKGYGIDSLVLPIESGSARVLKDIMHKPLTLSIIERVTNDCNKLGIYTNANILIGLPGETKQDIEDAVEFLKTLSVNWYNIHVAAPLPGSEMYDICKENGYLQDTDDYKCDFKSAYITTDDFTAEYILKKSYEMNLELNFVCNSDYRLGNYELALDKFLKVTGLAPNHFWAHYMSAKCLEQLGRANESAKYRERAKQILREDAQQRVYFEMFADKHETERIS